MLILSHKIIIPWAFISQEAIESNAAFFFNQIFVSRQSEPVKLLVRVKVNVFI